LKSRVKLGQRLIVRLGVGLTEIATGKPTRLHVGRNGGGEGVRGRWSPMVSWLFEN